MFRKGASGFAPREKLDLLGLASSQPTERMGPW